MVRAYILVLSLLCACVTSLHGMELSGAGPGNLIKNDTSLRALGALLGLEISFIVSVVIVQEAWHKKIFVFSASRKRLLSRIAFGFLLFGLGLKKFYDAKSVLSVLQKIVPTRAEVLRCLMLGLELNSF